MEDEDLLQAFVDAAAQAGLQVRRVSGRDLESELPTSSGVCRVGQMRWIVLAATDPIQRRIDVLAGALRDHAGEWLESRYLPPALRDRLASRDQGNG